MRYLDTIFTTNDDKGRYIYITTGDQSFILRVTTEDENNWFYDAWLDLDPRTNPNKTGWRASDVGYSLRKKGDHLVVSKNFSFIRKKARQIGQDLI